MDYIAELTEKWLLYLKTNRSDSPHTVVAYKSDLRQFLNFFNNHFAEMISLNLLKDLKYADIRSWLAHRHNDSYNSRSTARALSAVKSFFQFLIDNNIIDHHSIMNVKPPRLKRTLPRPLSIEQALYFIDNIENISEEKWIGQRDKTLFMLIYSVGLRISEALNLNQNDIDFLKDYLNILGKGNKYRQVPFLDKVKLQIGIYLSYLPFCKTNNSPLFYGLKGKRLTAGVAEVQMRRYRLLAGLPETATPHAFRHSCASHLLNSNNDLRPIQELLGHASLSSTQLYTAIDQEYLKKVYNSAHPRAFNKQNKEDDK